MLAHPYRRMLQRCTLLLLAGTALQLFLGPIDPSFLSYPWGVILALNYLYIIILLRANADKWQWVHRWYDRPAYISSLVSMLVLTLIFGLIRQDGSTEGVAGVLGFTRMARSWIFNLFLLHFTTIMGLKAVDDVWHIRKRRLPNVLIHLSIFVVLAAAIFGSGDKEKVKVTLALGVPERMSITKEGRAAELPFTLTLKEFSLEEYAPRIHCYKDDVLSPEFVVMDTVGRTGRLGEWQVECVDYLEHAGRVSEDSAYVAMRHVGATTAVLLRASHPAGGQTVEGWVSCGSHIFAGNTLQLPDGGELVMPQREVKKYLSQVELVGKVGVKQFDIAVNHPATIGAWKIYQTGYDSSRGRWSTISVVECVRDGWYILVHIALWMILVAGTLLFVMSQRLKSNGQQPTANSQRPTANS